MEKKLIFLIGFMGSGKSTIGPVLANAIGWHFIDLDLTIEQHVQLPIHEIFALKGESFFRAIEKEMLSHVSTMDNAVVATGGGMSCDQENRNLMHASGIQIWLQWHPDNLLKNAKNAGHLRPLLKDDDSFLELYYSRKQYYETADIIISCDNLTIQDIVNTILQSVTKYNIIDNDEVLDIV
ncbi:MAG: hypothetical protein A2Y62_17350 [Candidatus Fischerbacteria bacterium RBG_13_37_8]|uniref:Shikimate kinase n=1 Tax=Candidatus Fischerbacteria bacterium RBG_13_37_8 TaxID=1817863 RepID=A0A1F5VGE6_9BACT|nr:MAG: hypothetical protein A2Y62_17350 [Candidatus Fischerbacteria bacterium RBG_13_37_8]